MNSIVANMYICISAEFWCDPSKLVHLKGQADNRLEFWESCIPSEFECGLFACLWQFVTALHYIGEGTHCMMECT